MELPTWIIGGVLSLAGTGILGFWGWVALSIVKEGRQIAELQNRIYNQEQTCQQRLEWQRNMDEKLNQTAEGVQKLVGHFLEQKDNKGGNDVSANSENDANR